MIGMAAAGRSQELAHAFITITTEVYVNDEGERKSRKNAKCDLCGDTKVFSSIGRWTNHFTGEDKYCLRNGGLGACKSVPPETAEKFKKKVIDANFESFFSTFVTFNDIVMTGPRGGQSERENPKAVL